MLVVALHCAVDALRRVPKAYTLRVQALADLDELRRLCGVGLEGDTAAQDDAALAVWASAGAEASVVVERVSRALAGA